MDNQGIWIFKVPTDAIAGAVVQFQNAKYPLLVLKSGQTRSESEGTPPLKEVAAPARAADHPNLTPGNWQISRWSTSEGGGTQVETVVTYCIKPEHVKDSRSFAEWTLKAERNCQISDLNPASEKLSYSYSCEGGLSGTVELAFAVTSYEGTLKAQPMAMTEIIKGRRLGDCTAPARESFSGSVTSVDPGQNSFVVRSAKGADLAFKVTNKTRFTPKGKAWRDVAQGARVFVRYHNDGRENWALRIHMSPALGQARPPASSP
ncbi:MAG TPA: DUF3617 family protein [Thermoanaerobaculia bacterium]|nr:DUF3617 family protein [Thermoanaerobaculia bacterium]